MRLVFMGTPDFAVPVLRALAVDGHDIAGVICQPDRPAGRGKRPAPPPVKLAALELGLPVYQFERLRRQEGLDALRALKPDVCVTAAFGQILSQKLLDVPKLGTLNLHASLLPAYRGPAPAQWALISGETATGVTVMRTDIGVDTGDIILQETVTIEEADTAETLLSRLSAAGAPLMMRALAAWPNLPTRKQDEAVATHAPMLSKEDGYLDFSLDVQALINRARGVTPWPGAWCAMAGGVYKFVSLSLAEGFGQPGEILCADEGDGLVVACGKGAAAIGEIQAPGGRRMPARDYLRGHALPARRFDLPEIYFSRDASGGKP